MTRKLLFLNSLILPALFCLACSTVYKPIYVRSEIPMPEKITYDEPDFKPGKIGGQSMFYLDMDNAKRELKKREAVDAYIQMLENAITVNNDRAKSDQAEFDKKAGNKPKPEAKKEEVAPDTDSGD